MCVDSANKCDEVNDRSQRASRGRRTCPSLCGVPTTWEMRQHCRRLIVFELAAYAGGKVPNLAHKGRTWRFAWRSVRRVVNYFRKPPITAVFLRACFGRG